MAFLPFKHDRMLSNSADEFGATEKFCRTDVEEENRTVHYYDFTPQYYIEYFELFHMLIHP